MGKLRLYYMCVCVFLRVCEGMVCVENGVVFDSNLFYMNVAFFEWMLIGFVVIFYNR